MVEELRGQLKRFNQEHLLDFVDELNDDQRNRLIADIQSVDLEKTSQLFKEVSSNGDQASPAKLEPLNEQVYQSIRDLSADQRDRYKEIGLNAIRAGKVGILLLAGGQGSRLGVNYPKGMYDVGLPSHKSLFQLQAERLRRLQVLASGETGDAKIYWFIMTSGPTHQATVAYFEEHRYFGLASDQVTFFDQGTLPGFTFDGRIILSSKFELSRSPDGNGGLYDALKVNGIVDRLKALKIEFVHAYCVDNILVKVGDALFLGYCIDRNAETGVKSVEKDGPHEAVGVFCKVNGKYKVVEYSEISKELAEQRDEAGKLAFGCGNICNHFFTTEFLARVVNERLPHHVARKKIAHIDSDGNLIKPTKPNGIKLEKFIFDVLPFCERFAVLDVLREEEFSPVKNNDSELKDTPTTARRSIFRLHKSYIERAGGSLAESDEMACEISPLVSYDGENLKQLVDGKTIAPPVLISCDGEKTKSMLNFV